VSTGARLTLDKVNRALRREAKKLEIELKIFQIYDESRLIKTVSRNRTEVDGILINLGALSKNCYAFRELLEIIKLPVVEVHLKEFPFSKESFSDSVLKNTVTDRLIKPGLDAYLHGLSLLKAIVSQ
jgi:3-dehydroquinate dehydratase-2